MELTELCKSAKEVSRQIGNLDTNTKNEVLRAAAEAIVAHTEEIIRENEKDLARGRENHMPEGLLDRLMLNPSRLEQMAEGLRQVAELSDPIGEVLSMKKRPNGLMIGKKRVPLGVVGMIYEARPNVTVDAFALCFKTGNAVILKGGSDAISSNIVIVSVLQEVLAAAAKREASRLKRMAAGLDDLERWMCDLIRHGLGQLSGTPAWQKEAAARMVDAQLPGIAARLRNLQGVTSSGEDWPGVVLAQFGQLQLLIDAFRHLDALSPEEQADVRAALGLSPDKDEVLVTGERLSDLWLVLGVGYAEENRLWRRRVWLRGQNSGRTALLLDFSHGGKHFEQSFVVGSLADMTLAFYPGAAPLRAIATGDPVRAKTAPIPTVSLREALEGMAKAIAAQPWQWPLPLMVSDGVPCRSDDSWFLQTDAGDRLPLSITDNDGWELLTQGGGRPLSVWGEWDGARFQPLSAWEPGTSGSPLWREGARP